jgi:formylglycine-generating enzyme required for sulfatase activity
MTGRIAIDFGTTRTKVAYLPPKAGRPELLRFGDEEDRPFTPSLFCLPANSSAILFGDHVLEIVREGGEGVPRVPVKRQLRENKIRVSGRAEPPAHLLTAAFTALRAKAGREIACFAATPPEQVVLTLPCAWGPALRELMTQAARTAGFAQVDLVEEPVAAARAWLAESGAAADAVVVLDCGGGTVDWAYLRREVEELRPALDVPPGGIEGLGGEDVDLGLLELLELDLAAQGIAPSEIWTRRPRLLLQLRRLKEAVARGRPPFALPVGSASVTLATADIHAMIHSRLLARAVDGLRAYLERIATAENGPLPMVLLVGGSARLPGLAQAVGNLGVKVVGWDRSEFASVLGAIMPVATTATLAAASSGAPPGRTLREREEAWCPELVEIPGGSFVMGSSPDEPGHQPDEAPQRKVAVARFALGLGPITRTQYVRFCVATGRAHLAFAPHTADLPVTEVSWTDAAAYGAWLSGELGADYRLPTEAEWEYAARAGTSSPYWTGDTITPLQARFRRVQTGANVQEGLVTILLAMPVAASAGGYPANPFGLAHMLGNVFEWVADGWRSDYRNAPTAAATPVAASETGWRVYRGGAFDSPPLQLRAARRNKATPDFRAGNLGFRIARSFPG